MVQIVNCQFGFVPSGQSSSVDISQGQIGPNGAQLQSKGFKRDQELNRGRLEVKGGLVENLISSGERTVL